MKIHHLSCGTMCPLGGELIDGVTPGFGPATLVCHCLLIETNQGLVLVDTGFGLEDITEPRNRLSPFFRAVCRPDIREEHTAIRQIENLGFKAAEVRHIVLTHLDFDHAGGLSDFPLATVHVFEPEFTAASSPRGFINRNRFRPRQWPKPEQWQKYSLEGGGWFGFDCVHDLRGLPPEILLVPLIGHTHGHCGVAVQSKDKWLLLAGDAYFFHGEKEYRPFCPAGSRAYQKMMEVNRKARLENQEKIRNLHRNYRSDIEIFCSHDRTEFAELRGHIHESVSALEKHGSVG